MVSSGLEKVGDSDRGKSPLNATAERERNRVVKQV